MRASLSPKSATSDVLTATLAQARQAEPPLRTDQRAVLHAGCVELVRERSNCFDYPLGAALNMGEQS